MPFSSSQEEAIDVLPSLPFYLIIWLPSATWQSNLTHTASVPLSAACFALISAASQWACDGHNAACCWSLLASLSNTALLPSQPSVPPQGHPPGKGELKLCSFPNLPEKSLSGPIPFQAFSVWRGVVICWLITSLSVMWLIQRVVIWGERWGEGSEHDTCMWKIKTLLSAVLFLKLELTMRRERAVCSYLLLNTVWVWINQLILLSYFFMCKMKMIVTFFTELLGGLNIE